MCPRFLLTCKRGRAQKQEKEARSLLFLLRPRLVQQPARERICPSPVHAFSTCHLEKLWLHMPLGRSFTVGPHSSCHSWALISSLLSKLSFSFEATRPATTAAIPIWKSWGLPLMGFWAGGRMQTFISVSCIQVYKKSMPCMHFWKKGFQLCCSLILAIPVWCNINSLNWFW